MSIIINTIEVLEHNCIEVTRNTLKFIAKLDHKPDKAEIKNMSNDQKIYKVLNDKIISKKEYKELFMNGKSGPKKLKEKLERKTKIKKEIIEIDDFVGSRMNDERETYIENVHTKNSNVKKFTLDSVKNKKRVGKYYLPESTIAIARRVILNRPIWINGNAGTGKTSFIYALADLMGIDQVVRVNFHIGTTEQHLIGKTLAKDGETYFSYGILPTVMQSGGWLILDELDYAQPEHNAVLQPVLEGKPLFIPQAGNVTIHPHPNFRIFATGNTKGRGDETRLYFGTNYQNASFLDRFSKFEFDYTKDEQKIINEILDDKILSKQLMKFFEILRTNIENGSITNAVFTTRKLEQIAELVKFGEPLFETIQYEIIDSFNNFEKPGIIEIMYDVWDKECYKHWVLGDEHFVKADEPVQESVEQTEASEEVEDDTVDAVKMVLSTQQHLPNAKKIKTYKP